MFFISKGCATTRKYMGTKCMMLLSGKLSYPSFLIDCFFFFLLSAWLDDSFYFFWCGIIQWALVLQSAPCMQPAVPVEVREGDYLAGTLQKWAMDINSPVYGWSKNIFFFYTHLGGFICLCFIQFDIESDVFNNFMNISMGFSLNCENFQMFF